MQQGFNAYVALLVQQPTENLSMALDIWICFYKFFNGTKELICGKNRTGCRILTLLPVHHCNILSHLQPWSRQSEGAPSHSTSTLKNHLLSSLLWTFSVLPSSPVPFLCVKLQYLETQYLEILCALELSFCRSNNTMVNLERTQSSLSSTMTSSFSPSVL